MNNLFLVLHLCSSEPCLTVAQRCDDLGTEDDPGPWWITPLGGWRVYPYWTCQMPVQIPDITPPPDAIDTYAANGWVEPNVPKFDIVAAMRKRFAPEPIKRRI